MQTSSSALQSAVDSTVVPKALSAQTLVADSGLDLSTPGSQLYAAEQARLSIFNAMGSAEGPTGLYANMTALDAAVAPLATALVIETTGTVGAYLDAIYQHVDAFLSEDCKANLVTVPILTHNAAGFYTGPTIGLQQALQSYLDARKEVTHTVKVTSGEGNLVRPVIQVRAGVKLGYSLSVTKAAIESAIDGLLQDRDFGASLYLSDFCPIIDELVAGLSFLNVTIQGYNDVSGELRADKLDESGNLVIEASEVISKEDRLTLPSVSVTTELAPLV